MIFQKELPSETRTTQILGTYAPQTQTPNTVDVSTDRRVVTKEPIVVDTVKKTVLEEVQPGKSSTNFLT